MCDVGWWSLMYEGAVWGSRLCASTSGSDDSGPLFMWMGPNWAGTPACICPCILHMVDVALPGHGMS